MRHEPQLGRPVTALPASVELQSALSRELETLLRPGERQGLLAQLIAAGFSDPIAADRRIREWRERGPAALHSQSACRALEALAPTVIARLATFSSPDGALTTLDEIIGRLPADVMPSSAADSWPWLISSLLDLLGHAPALARHLVVEPRLVRTLIDGRAYAPLPSSDQLDAEFAGLLDEGDHSNVARAINGYRFVLGLQLLEGTSDALDLAMSSCDLAEAGLRAMAGDVLSRMKATHGEVPEAELVILALGRFGGRSLTSSSNLDIIYLFTGDCHAQSDGRNPLDANEYFSRMAHQITMAMATATPLGQLYEVDSPLRPWGAEGMLACSTDTYRRYHEDNAWTREHMALTRARPVYGSRSARAEVKRIIDQSLRAPRDRATLLRDAVKMRSDIARHQPARGDFDVKLVDGGLVDLEFAVHVNQLAEHSGIGPRLGAAIRAQIAAGLADMALIDAHQVLSRMLIVLRLLSPGGQEPVPERRGAIAHACGFDDWQDLTAAYAEARESVREAWRRSITRPGE